MGWREGIEDWKLRIEVCGVQVPFRIPTNEKRGRRAGIQNSKLRIQNWFREWAAFLIPHS